MSDHKGRPGNPTSKGASQDGRFVNPYNFVPLEDSCYRERVHEESDSQAEKLTGYMECSIRLKTPIFIPNTSYDRAFTENRENKPKSYDFFSYDDLSGSDPGSRTAKYSQPVIPGSEIRGVLRSVHEAAFNGCMSSVQEKRQMSRRSSEPKKPGILRWNSKKEGWEIQPCERLMLNTSFRLPEQEVQHGKYMSLEQYDKLKEGQKIYVQRSKKKYIKILKKGTQIPIAHTVVNYTTYNEPLGWEEAYIHKGEPFKTKHHESVFVIDKKKMVIPVHHKELDRLESVLNRYASKDVNKDLERNPPHSGYKKYKEDYLMKTMGQQNILIYYSESQQGTEKMAEYLSPSMLSQEVFLNDMERLLKSNGGYQPCADRNCVCLTCRLFGMVAKDKGKSLGSRLRIEDAHVVNPLASHEVRKYYHQEIQLPEMGEPKPGSAEFYVSRPQKKVNGKDALHWTYDYAQFQGTPRTPLTDAEVKLRGRKFYWHHEGWRPVVKEIYQHSPKQNARSTHTSESGNRNEKMIQVIRPLRSELAESHKPVVFTFNLYFERITQKELADLLWTLDFEDQNCAHKIGRAKPLGFGSIQIKVDHIHQRRINRSTGEWELEPIAREKYKIEGLSSSMQTVKRVTTWKHKELNQQVSYPKMEVSSRDKKANDGASHQWFTANRKDKGNFEKELPTIEEELNNKEKWLYKKRKN